MRKIESKKELFLVYEDRTSRGMETFPGRREGGKVGEIS